MANPKGFAAVAAGFRIQQAVLFLHLARDAASFREPSLQSSVTTPLLQRLLRKSNLSQDISPDPKYYDASAPIEAIRR